jgi:hypothetical protein
MFYEPKFRHIIEMHLPQLRTIYAIPKEIGADEYYQYEGDFYGFLRNRGYQVEMFWVLLRINGMTNPLMFGKSLRDPYSDGSIPLFIEPHPSAIAELQQYYMTLKR